METGRKAEEEKQQNKLKSQWTKETKTQTL